MNMANRSFLTTCLFAVGINFFPVWVHADESMLPVVAEGINFSFPCGYMQMSPYLTLKSKIGDTGI